MKIVPRIHRLVLSGDYTADELRQFLGKLYIIERNPRRRKDYQFMASVHFKEMNRSSLLTIFYSPGPKSQYKPHEMIELTLPEKNPQQFLSILNQTLPNLKISKVEYAVDFYVSTGSDTRPLYNVLWRNLCPKNQQKVKQDHSKDKGIAKYGKFILLTWNNRKRILNRNRKISNHLKMYERGEDIHKTKSNRWYAKNLDRVRIEFTGKRKWVRDSGLKNLDNLVKDARFYDTMNEKIRFQCAILSSKKLPLEPGKYNAVDEYGNSGSFFIDFKKAYKQFKTAIYKQIQTPKEFEEIQNWVFDEMKDFDSKWKQAI